MLDFFVFIFFLVSQLLFLFVCSFFVLFLVFWPVISPVHNSGDLQVERRQLLVSTSWLKENLDSKLSKPISVTSFKKMQESIKFKNWVYEVNNSIQLICPLWGSWRKNLFIFCKILYFPQRYHAWYFVALFHVSLNIFFKYLYVLM